MIDQPKPAIKVTDLVFNPKIFYRKTCKFFLLHVVGNFFLDSPLKSRGASFSVLQGKRPSKN